MDKNQDIIDKYAPKPTDDDEIVVEVRTTLGVVKPGNGIESMVTVAFRIATEYVADEADNNRPSEATFEYRGVTYRASADYR